jgi:glycosyltransferase involved in cell wall biosynthesis
MPKTVEKVHLSIIIPTHRRHKELFNLIHSLQGQSLDGLNIETIIISNLADQTLHQKIHQIQSPQLSISFFTRGEVGVNKARNLGISKSSSENLYFLDDDVSLLDPFHLQKLVALVRKYPNATAIGGGYILPNQAGLLNRAYHIISSSWVNDEEASKAFSFLVGGNTLYRRSLMSDFLFNESILFGGSETELNLRLYKANKEMIYLKCLSIEHNSPITIYSFIYKAIRQGMGRFRHESIVSPQLLQYNTDSRKSYSSGLKCPSLFNGLISFYIAIYRFFFQVGYRHGKKSLNGPLSYFTLCICLLENFFSPDSITPISNPKEIAYHEKSIPSLKVKEIYHWSKAHVWWRIYPILRWHLPQRMLFYSAPFIEQILIFFGVFFTPAEDSNFLYSYCNCKNYLKGVMQKNHMAKVVN